MATTRDYIEYLGEQIDIAPVNSQEELQAAQVIQGLVGQHGLEARLQEFDAPAWGGLPYRVLMIVMLVGVVMAGLQETPVAIPGILLTLVCLALFVARWLGTDLVGNLGPRVRSQNVVAVHRAEGPLVAKGNRPIVVVAHYDTPRAGFLYAPQMRRLLPAVLRVVPYLVLAVGVAGFIQLLGFLPGSFRRVVWVLGMVAALPLLVLGVGAVQERLAGCTDGANDNKAAVAALLGVLAHVRPAPDAADGHAPEAPADEEPAWEDEAPEDEAIEAPAQDEEGAHSGNTVVVERQEQPLGVRHGAEVLAELRILPDTCEVVYVIPSPPRPARVHTGDGATPAAEEADDESLTSTGRVVARGAAALSSVGERGRALFGRLERRLGRDQEGAVARADAVGEGDSAAEQDLSADGASEVAPGVTFSSERDPSDSEVARKDMSGMDAVVDVVDPSARRTVEAAPAPARIDDPSWGKSDLAPAPSQSVARRAVLYDLPDPSAQSSDPFAPDGAATPVRRRGAAGPSQASVGTRVSQGTGIASVPVIEYGPSTDGASPRAGARPGTDAGAEAGAAPSVTPTASPASSPATGEVTAAFNLPSAPQPVHPAGDMPLLTPLAGSGPASAGASGRSTRRRRGRRGEDPGSMSDWLGVEEDYDAHRGGQSIGSWDNFDTGPVRRDGGWKGGATNRPDLRLVDDDEQVEELREAVLGLGDDELIAHDIWFVALGASSLDHAGMRAFLGEYRSQIRGSFVINLSCVGSGELSVLGREGIDNPRRVDRRMERLVSNVADDLHLSLGRSVLDWGTTDATPAMRASMRAMTLVGLDEAGVPAGSHTMDDVAENVDEAQATGVCDLVCELIRRS